MASVNYGETDRTRGVLTYSTSQTETQVTVTARTQLQAKSYGYSGYRLNTKYAGATVSTKLSYVPSIYTSWTTCIDTGDYSKTYTRTHSAQSVVVKSEYYGEGTGDYYAGSKSGDYSVTISIPAKASYTITYNANSGSGAPSAQTKWYGEDLTLSSTVPTRTNYIFKGWATSSTATTAAYSAGGKYTANAAATLYAVWQLNAYTVTYNKGANGTGTNTTDTKIHGTPLTLKGAIFTRTGYTQTGWSTTDGGSKTYNLNYSYTTNAAVTLYPFWTLNSWTVSYNANGGSGAPSSQTKYYNQTLALSSTKPTKANASAGSYTVTYNGNGGTASAASASAARTTAYTFSKWNTNSSGTGTNYSSGGNYTANSAATLYAIYSETTTTAAVSLTSASRTGYTFAGWYTASSGGTRVGGSGSSYTPTKSLTLYAHWTANTYTISFNKNTTATVSNMPSSQTKTQDVALTLTSTKPTRTDYLFKGWGTSNGTTTVTYLPGAKYTGNADATLYAVWQLNYSSPKITGTSGGTTIPSVYRSNSSGTAQDDGTYIRVNFAWSTFSTNYKATQVKVQYKRSTASSWTDGYKNDNPNASSGTVTQTIGGSINTEYTYDVLITVTDSVGSATFSTFVSSAFFPIDVGTARTSLGFGVSALDSSIPSNGRADFGMDAHFNNAVYLGDNQLKYITHQYLRTSTQLSSAGWYRIASWNIGASTNTRGGTGIAVDFVIASQYQATNNCLHKISLIGVWDKIAFVDETSTSNTNGITKIRYTRSTSNSGAIDIYYNLATANHVRVDIAPYFALSFAVEDFMLVAASPSDETVVTEYTFDPNLESGVFSVSDTYTTSSGGYINLESSYSRSKYAIISAYTTSPADSFVRITGSVSQWVRVLKADGTAVSSTDVTLTLVLYKL